MRLVADENVDGPLVAWLREQGHDVVWIAESAPAAGDTDVLSESLLSGRVLLTFDLDFGEMVFRKRAKAVGVVLFRLQATSARELYELFKRNWRTIDLQLTGKFIVVANNRIRIRNLPTDTI